MEGVHSLLPGGWLLAAPHAGRLALCPLAVPLRAEHGESCVTGKGPCAPGQAAGSSLLARLANLLAADALAAAGMADLGGATVLPLATGMALTLTLLALRPLRPPGARCGAGHPRSQGIGSGRAPVLALPVSQVLEAAHLSWQGVRSWTPCRARRSPCARHCGRYVLWPRIDQKTCLKAIASAGLEAVPLALAQHGDELRTDMALLERELARLGAQNVVAVVTTTSCFAPRAADDVVAARRPSGCVCGSRGACRVSRFCLVQAGS